MVVLVPSFHTHIIIISDCYWSVNTYFNRATILLEWFHHLVLLWKYTELRSVKFKCHFRAISSFFSNTSALFLLKWGSLISQLPIIIAKSYLLKIVSLLLMSAVACIKRRGCSLWRKIPYLEEGRVEIYPFLLHGSSIILIGKLKWGEKYRFYKEMRKLLLISRI